MQHNALAVHEAKQHWQFYAVALEDQDVQYITKYGSTLYNRDGRGLCPLCLYIRKLHFPIQ